jgi:hypothetical protein
MAERRKPKSLDVNFDYVFDRLLIHKLQQAYEILVPDNVRVTGGQMEPPLDEDEAKPNVRTCLLRQAERPQRSRDSGRRLG